MATFRVSLATGLGHHAFLIFLYVVNDDEPVDSGLLYFQTNPYGCRMKHRPSLKVVSVAHCLALGEAISSV